MPSRSDFIFRLFFSLICAYGCWFTYNLQDYVDSKNISLFLAFVTVILGYGAVGGLYAMFKKE